MPLQERKQTAVAGERRGPVTERLFLVGMMGAGKSVVGQAVAQRLGWSFVDTDQEVRRSTGQSVPEIFASGGEERFRNEESRALLTCAAGSVPTVVSVGGGAVLSRENRELLSRSGLVVGLRAGLETLAQRVRGGAGRPLLEAAGAADGAGATSTDGEKERVLRSLVAIEAERRALYVEVAGAVVDVDALSVKEVADRVVDLVRAGSPARSSEGGKPL